MRAVRLAVLMIDSALLAAAALMFQQLYVGAVPAPVGTLIAAVSLPWLVFRCAEVDPAPGVAGSPIIIWLLVIGVLGLGGPGADVLLPADWTSALLVIVGLGAGLIALRMTIEANGRATRDPAGPAEPARKAGAGRG